MAKLANYRCIKCGHDEEYFFDDTNDQNEIGKKPCPKCGSKMKKFNFKNNPQRVRIYD
jgi:ssDNA-binding Zn-finger/Zn-ribbon topoisomerase 1